MIETEKQIISNDTFGNYEIEDGELVCYEQQTNDETIIEKIGDKYYMILNNFCLNSSCNCKDSILSFADVTESCTCDEHNTDNVVEDFGDIKYNYKKNKFELLDCEKKYFVVLNEIMESLKKKKGFDQIVKKRHKMLRKFYLKRKTNQ